MQENSSAVVIREAVASDVPLIARYNMELALETANRHLDRATVLAGVQAVFNTPELGQYFVAIYQQELIGQAMVTYEWSDWRSGLFWWVQSVYVRPDARRRGTCAALFDHIRQRAKAMPTVVGLRLQVPQPNAAAQKVCQRLGFKPSGQTMFEQDWSAN